MNEIWHDIDFSEIEESEIEESGKGEKQHLI
jgi:hypothetical protein